MFAIKIAKKRQNIRIKSKTANFKYYLMVNYKDKEIVVGDTGLELVTPSL